MTHKEKAELARLGRAWACGRATKAQMLRHTELARKDDFERAKQGREATKNHDPGAAA